MMDLYREIIIDHYKNPRNTEIPSESEYSQKLQNLSCGDEVEVFINTENHIIKDIYHKSEGCAISIAAASILSEELVGKSVQEVLSLDEGFVQELLGVQLSISRVKCAHMALEAIQNALT